jgi:hypothetical protein
MAGENIPIDYLSDHLKEGFQLVVTFVPGYGYLGMIKFDGREVYWTGKYRPEAQEAFDAVCKFLEEKYMDIMNEMGL